MMRLTFVQTGLNEVTTEIYIRTRTISILHVPLQNYDIITGGDFNFELDTN